MFSFERLMVAVAGGVVATACVLSAAGWGNGSRLGPPMLCHPLEIGDAKSIVEPSDGTKVPTAKEVIAVLDGSTSALVHMETLRRATLAAERGGGGEELLKRLAYRALDAGAGEKREAAAMAYFDAAYLVGCLRQDGPLGEGLGVAEKIDGYLWMRHALKLSPDNGEMALGAALLAHPAMQRGADELFRKHMAAAAKGASKGSLLEKNVRRQEEMWERYLK